MRRIGGDFLFQYKNRSGTGVIYILQMQSGIEQGTVYGRFIVLQNFALPQFSGFSQMGRHMGFMGFHKFLQIFPDLFP